MDERELGVLGEAIGRSVSESYQKLIPEMSDAMVRAVTAAQTGVYVEVSTAEMATRLASRAQRLRARAEEVLAAPIEEAVAEVLGLPPNFEASSGEEQQRFLAMRETTTRNVQKGRLRRAEEMREDAERLDFMAGHLPKDREAIRLERRELDGLLFDDCRYGGPV